LLLYEEIADDQAISSVFALTKYVQEVMMDISSFGIKIPVDSKVYGKEMGLLLMVSSHIFRRVKADK
jgi:hypothetical protein